MTHGTPTRQSTRFGAFALCHVLISIIGAALTWVFLIAKSNMWIWCIWDGILMLLYAVSGVWVAWIRHWTRPKGGLAGLWAVLALALLAWTWEALVLVSVINGENVFWGYIGVGLLYLALFLATPSTLFMCLAVLCGLSSSGNFTNYFLVSMWLAGFLPPFLFFLGSLCILKTDVAEFGG